MTTPEVTSVLLTFDKLHDGLIDCNCATHEGVEEIDNAMSLSFFTRLLRREPSPERVLSFTVESKNAQICIPRFWPTVKAWESPTKLQGRYFQIVDADFESHHEIPVPTTKDLVSCRDFCEWRGVSINRLLNNNMERIRDKYRSIRKHSKAKVFGDYLCVFRLFSNAGLVWNSNPGSYIQHYNLLKSDSFNMQVVTVTRIEPID